MITADVSGPDVVECTHHEPVSGVFARPAPGPGGQQEPAAEPPSAPVSMRDATHHVITVLWPLAAGTVDPRLLSAKELRDVADEVVKVVTRLRVAADDAESREQDVRARLIIINAIQVKQALTTGHPGQG